MYEIYVDLKKKQVINNKEGAFYEGWAFANEYSVWVNKFAHKAQVWTRLWTRISNVAILNFWNGTNKYIKSK